ncbi:hypothetical protein QYE76_052380 [Lolium multiflorum]|uniref:DUF4283 domain-containing protein n=1 Tax=Lolium multiflorum TaxID=4521 RepID=A0AAD8SV95_LOLMU|nr:hypothetical protein QYE76_052380 [Lolium multiflorum]
MCDLERRLRFAMVASVRGRMPAVSSEQVAAALRWHGIPATAFSVHAHAPEDFLVVFESAELRRHVAALPSVLVAGAPLILRPWNRQSQAKQVSLRSKVSLVLEGILPHAWDVEVVEDLLGKSCAVEEVAPETRSRADLSLFKLSAWTSELDVIPVARTLAVPEPLRELTAAVVARAGSSSPSSASGVSEIKTLQYQILIHVVAVEEFEPEGMEQRTGVQGGDGSGRRGEGPQSGHGGGDGDGGEPGRRRRRTVPWTRGVPDLRGGLGGGSSHRHAGTGGILPQEERASWGLPPLELPGPWTIQTSLNEVASNLEGTGGPRTTAVHPVGDQEKVCGRGQHVRRMLSMWPLDQQHLRHRVLEIARRTRKRKRREMRRIFRWWGR